MQQKLFWIVLKLSRIYEMDKAATAKQSNEMHLASGIATSLNKLELVQKTNDECVLKLEKTKELHIKTRVNEFRFMSKAIQMTREECNDSLLMTNKKTGILYVHNTNKVNFNHNNNVQRKLLESRRINLQNETSLEKFKKKRA